MLLFAKLCSVLLDPSNHPFGKDIENFEAPALHLQRDALQLDYFDIYREVGSEL